VLASLGGKIEGDVIIESVAAVFDVVSWLINDNDLDSSSFTVVIVVTKSSFIRLPMSHQMIDQLECKDREKGISNIYL
jgi:hypothetical protein